VDERGVAAACGQKRPAGGARAAGDADRLVDALLAAMGHAHAAAVELLDGNFALGAVELDAVAVDHFAAAGSGSSMPNSSAHSLAAQTTPMSMLSGSESSKGLFFSNTRWPMTCRIQPPTNIPAPSSGLNGKIGSDATMAGMPTMWVRRVPG